MPQNFLHADIHVLATCRIAVCRCIVYATSRDAESGCRCRQISLSRTCMYSSLPIEHCALEITVEDAGYVESSRVLVDWLPRRRYTYIFGLRSGQLCFPPPSPTSVLYIHIYSPRTYIHAKCLLQIWLQSNPYHPAQALHPQYCHRVSLYCLRAPIRPPTHGEQKISRNTLKPSGDTSGKKNASTTSRPRQSRRSQSTLRNSLRASTSSTVSRRHGTGWPCCRCMSWPS